MNYARYLRSKITVDDRALNMGVLQSLEEYVEQTVKMYPSYCLRIVEVGGGVGAMFSRLYKRKSIFESCKFVEYTLIDMKEEVVNAAREDLTNLLECEKGEASLDVRPRLEGIASNIIRDANVEDCSSIHTSGIANDAKATSTSMQFPNGITVNIVFGDALKCLSNTPNHFDIVIAAAVLDLWQVDEALPLLQGCLKRSSIVRACYFPINFDGVTDFFPPSIMGTTSDNQVVNVFHNSMGLRNTLGERTMSCHTGRRLIPTLQQYGALLKSVGGSAWTVYPNRDGSYPADEKYFLSCIISFIEETVKHSHDSHVVRDPHAFQEYLESRRKQLEEGILYYLAHNIDIFCVI